MAACELVETALQRRRIERARDAPAVRDIVGGQARFQPVEHPEPFLPEGQRHTCGAINARDRGPGGWGVGQVGEQLRLVRGQLRPQLRRERARRRAEAQAVAFAPELDVAAAEFLEQFHHSAPSSRAAAPLAACSVSTNPAIVGRSKIWRTCTPGYCGPRSRLTTCMAASE